MPPAPRPKSWFERHWPWLVPLGCLGVLVVIAALTAVIMVIAEVAMRSSDVCRDAVARAATDPVVQRELGPPVEVGWFISGSVRVSGPSGEADLSIPIVGSLREGTLYAVGTKSAGRWTFTTLEVEIDGNPTRIPLLPPAPPP